MIHWEKYFDAVYCIHYIPQTDKWEPLVAELKRVDLWDSKIFHMRYTYASRYNALFYDACKKDVEQRVNEFKNVYRNRYASKTWVSLGFMTLSILQESLFRNYSRILILENDIAFLKSKDLITVILDHMPSGAGLIHFDWLGDSITQGAMTKWSCREYNQYYAYGILPKYTRVFGGSCYAVTRPAIELLCDALENVALLAPDAWLSSIQQTRKTIQCYFAIKRLAIQKIYESADYHTHSLDSDQLNAYMSMTYPIDFSLYEVPDNYPISNMSQLN